MKAAVRIAGWTRRVPALTNLLRSVLPLSLKRRLGAALLPSRCDGETVRSTDGRTFLIIPDRLFLRVMYDGNYEPGQSAFMASIIEPGDVCVDVGANFGWYATLLGGKARKTFAYEPQARSFDFLNRNLELNDLTGRVVSRHRAVGAEPGTITLIVDGPSERESGLAHIAAAGETGSEAVDVVRLDDELADYIGQISLIKMDIEGAEIGVIRGAEAVLSSESPPVLVAEANDAALVRLGSSRHEMCHILQRHGYTIHALSANGGVTPDDGKADSIVCVPNRGQFADRVKATQ